MFKNKFKKTIISILFAGFLIPQISLATPNPTYESFLRNAKCVPSYVGDPLCEGTTGSSAGGAVAKLYKAIFSQGAVITLLDEPLTSNPEELITVLRMCSYKQGTGGAIVINACSEYYVNSCPPEDKSGNKFISPELKKTIPNGKSIEQMAYFTCSTKQVLIAASGTGLIQKYLKLIYNFGTMAAGIFAILMIMFNGIKISVSGSDEGAVDEAKKQITNSLLALTVLFLSGFILYIINPNFFTSI